MTTMSSLAALTGRAEDTGFAADLRFAAMGASALPKLAHPSDPLGEAWAQGFAEGAAQARAEAAGSAAIEDEARVALDLAFTRMDCQMADELRHRLTETILALFDATMLPCALDAELLTMRVERAVAMLARADDERVIRLNPDDLELISPRLPQEWAIGPDAALPRGHLRVETANGGVEDGPAQWRRALVEALAGC